jgi:hypothetical protein
MSGFRPIIRFSAGRSRLVAGAAATSVIAAAMIMSGPAASAAVTPGGGPARHGPAQQAATTKEQQADQQDYTFYDSTTPAEIPAHQDIAVYANGEYAAQPSSVGDSTQVIWIDVEGNDADATALDVEPGDAAPADVAGWVKHRLQAHPDALAIVYTMRSEWDAAKASVATLPPWMRARVRWWIADPTGHEHIVPGSQATQWYWGQNYDISTALPDF